MKVEVGALSWMAYALLCQFSAVIQGKKKSQFHKSHIFSLLKKCIYTSFSL